jgi:hypothetical protein
MIKRLYLAGPMSGIKHLLTCDSVALLEGWTASRGARLEQHVALELGMAPRLASFFVRPPVLESTLQEIA